MRSTLLVGLHTLAAAAGLWVGLHPEHLDALFPTGYPGEVVEIPDVGHTPVVPDIRLRSIEPNLPDSR